MTTAFSRDMQKLLFFIHILAFQSGDFIFS